MINKIIRFFLENRLVTFILVGMIIIGGIVYSPFRWNVGFLPSDPVPVDALPDIGENQQIVFTEWDGRSAQDIEDQITYPLTTSLLGLPGVKHVRSSSVLGFSSIAIIFEDDVDFYWSRTRILEKIASLSPELLPDGVRPTLGPDATALGQVFWYTLEGRDKEGNPTGGWDLHEIRKVQDYYVKYALNGVEGVSEVASIGGHIQEYQIDVRPEELRQFGVTMQDIAGAVSQSNKDVGAHTMEINQAEYLVRGLGYIKSLEDIEKIVVKEVNQTPVYLSQVAYINLGPAPKRGALDKDGAEVVGGVVAARFGANAMQVIDHVKDKIIDISAGLPSKVLDNGVESQLTIVPFYDRSGLIQETLMTLNDAIFLQVLITVLVIVVMIYNLRTSIVISVLMPLGVLMVFIAMRWFGVDANIVALSGIAIAIGAMVDLGVILAENVMKHMEEFPAKGLFKQIYEGASEVSSAIVTAVSTTIISFLPVFTLQAAEGKLFGPLAYTKTFALVAALLITLIILPTFIYVLFRVRVKTVLSTLIVYGLLGALGIYAFLKGLLFVGFLLLVWAIIGAVKIKMQSSIAALPKCLSYIVNKCDIIAVLIYVMWILATYWTPLGVTASIFYNLLFVGLLVGLILLFFGLIRYYYTQVLNWCLENKMLFLSLPVLLIALGLIIWLGFSQVFGFVEKSGDRIGVNIRTNKVWSNLSHTFPGIGKEFMPALDEGSFLLMPTSMPHSGVEYNQRVLAQLDQLISSIPEVENTVGKLGRAETAMDPAPVSMYENVINYKGQYMLDESLDQLRFKTNKKGEFILSSGDTLNNDRVLEEGLVSLLIIDESGKPFRNWRSHIKNSDDIWQEIVDIANIPGVTSAPKLQPIETRLVMLSTGLGAPMGIKVYGPDLESIEHFGLDLERILKTIPSVKHEAVFAERVVGKPYLHLKIDREAIARYGLTIDQVQQSIEMGIGGLEVSKTVEGRQRFSIRVRYPRELRNSPEDLENILVSNDKGQQIPLSNLVELKYQQGPQEIKSEDTFLVSYVLFDKGAGFSEIKVADDVKKTIDKKIEEGEVSLPAGVSYQIAGNYENQVRSQERLSFVVPIVLVLVLLILYFQFRSILTALMVFSAIALAFCGGFILLWLYGQNWFADFSIFSTSMRELFQMKTIHLSVAVWVGFIALFGLATDDGVMMGTYLDQSFNKKSPKSLKELRELVIFAANKRIRPAVMTSATTVIALLPVLTSSGRGADIMIPMAIPAFGGMIMTCVTYYLLPVLYALKKEKEFKKINHED